MDTKTGHVFMHEVQKQCEFALRSYMLVGDLFVRTRQQQQQARSIMALPSPNISGPNDPVLQTYLQQREFANQLYKQNHEDIRFVWIYLHAFFAHVANISKLLWNDSPRGNAARKQEVIERCSWLRSELGINEGSINNRSLRNNLEHFDERLHDWLAASPNVIVDSSIAPIGGPMVTAAWLDPNHEIDPKHELRRFDPDTMTFVFFGEEFSLSTMTSEVETIRLAAENWLAREQR